MDVAVRVDASTQIGAGHLMRCLTLANAIHARSGHVTFLCRELPDSLAPLIAAQGHELVRLSDSEAPGARQFDWLVVDHYQLDAAWESRARAVAKRIFVIDDLADRPHDCDVLLDQNLYTDGELRYSGRVPPACRLLLGPRYALLRAEFGRLRAGVRPRTGKVGRLLVFFGGGDAGNQTTTALEALSRIDAPRNVDVVIGAEHPHRGPIEKLCAARGYQLHVQTSRMAELMAAADLAVGAGGSATWERCCLGLPSLVVSVAANQDRLVHDGALAGTVYAPEGVLSSPDDLARHIRAFMDNPLLRESMSRKGMEVVDGRGVDRVLPALGLGRVTMRPAVIADSDNLFVWRNHPSIRGVSRSQKPLERAAHERWLGAALSDSSRVLLIGECRGQPVGVVRFDIQEAVAEVSIYVVPGQERCGFGAELLAAAEAWLGSHRSAVREVSAEVLAANQPSHRLFRGAGYQLESTLYRKRMQ